ncbi:endonuclease [Scytonema sp. UIC 10036]|uniref:RNA-guided endonuclease IscB n=1 Tax=Scytonema sp. UIC 10036 TaxID=2304196 RepID=UPI0012DA396B|nr:RNA-guided endonuclease IscB [Scytonema sp. UIC 10036]MUG92534.1 endonuclease [Scytonema sp. UIC 10036]MUH00242.1 endonuclease [Scytonema sp. UIC 10036]
MITNSVFVLSKNGKILKPTTPVRARILQSQGKAKKLNLFPFTLILESMVDENVEPYLELRIDPGSKITGFSLVDLNKNEVIWAMELEHRGLAIKMEMLTRAGVRRSRRSRRLRYRKKRFERKKPQGWLPPSLRHRLLTTETWIKRLLKVTPIKSIAIESVKFDLQKMETPNIEGIEYQQGTLFGYTLREVLLEHWGRECVYCGKTNVPLQIEHINPRSLGGSDRFSNLTLSCEKCNQKKGNKPVEQFLKNKGEILQKIKAHQKKSLSDAATVNSTRKAIFEMAQQFGLPVMSGDGASTKMIRIKSGLPKLHWIDSACVGTSEIVKLRICQPLRATCTGHGTRLVQRMNAKGFPAIASIKKNPMTGKKEVKLVAKNQKYTHATAGDYVVCTLLKDRKHVRWGIYRARVKTPTPKGVEVLINGHRISLDRRHVKLIHQSDGYEYSFTTIDQDLLRFSAI